VGILSNGKMVIEGSIAELGREAMSGGRYTIEVETAEPNVELVDILKKIEGVDKVEASDNILRVSTGSDLRSEIARAVVNSNASLVQIKVHEFSLDDIYMKYFKEE
jgi:ABC-2 type transport system ATP-binding protein